MVCSVCYLLRALIVFQCAPLQLVAVDSGSKDKPFPRAVFRIANDCQLKVAILGVHNHAWSKPKGEQEEDYMKDDPVKECRHRYVVGS